MAIMDTIFIVATRRIKEQNVGNTVTTKNSKCISVSITWVLCCEFLDIFDISDVKVCETQNVFFALKLMLKRVCLGPMLI